MTASYLDVELDAKLFDLRGAAGQGTRITRRDAVPAEDLNRAIEDVRPGETVRIPVVNEEIIVERRPVGRS